MIIGIEAQRIFRKKKHGMDMVALELIRNLMKENDGNEYVVFVHPDEEDHLLGSVPGFRIVKTAGAFYPFWEQIALPRAARQAGCDILHCTSNTAPLFTRIPLLVTLHDIIYMEKSYLEILRGSGSWYQKTGNVYRRFVVPRVLGKSKKIITVSEFEKNRIASFFGLPDDGRLIAVHNGVGEHFKPVTDADRLKGIKERYSLPDRFFFFLGNTDPKKNTAGTLKAFSNFIERSGSDIKLVMLDYDRTELEKLLRSVDAASIGDRIILTGYVPNSELPAIYSLCEAFLYPSLRESFGLPVLEAMACGAPVITSNTSSMPEIAGDAALIIDPFNTEDLSGAMQRITNDMALRDSLINKGMERAALFSWMNMAGKVRAVYRELSA